MHTRGPATLQSLLAATATAAAAATVPVADDEAAEAAAAAAAAAPKADCAAVFPERHERVMRMEHTSEHHRF